MVHASVICHIPEVNQSLLGVYVLRYVTANGAVERGIGTG